MDIILNNYIDITLFCRFTFRLRIQCLSPSPATLTVLCVCAPNGHRGVGTKRRKSRKVDSDDDLSLRALRLRRETHPSPLQQQTASSLSHYSIGINIARICIAIRAEFVFLCFKKKSVLRSPRFIVRSCTIMIFTLYFRIL